MGGTIAVISILVFLLLSLVWRIREGVRSRHAVRDDTRRSGDATARSPMDAARYAEGTTAWTRLSGP